MRTLHVASFVALLAACVRAEPMVGEVTIGRLGAAVEFRYSLFNVSAKGEVEKAAMARVDYLRMEDIGEISFVPTQAATPRGEPVAAVLVLTRGQSGEPRRHTFLFRPGKADEAREVADVLAQTVFLPPSALEGGARKATSRQ